MARRRLAEAGAAGDADQLARAILGFVADRQGRPVSAVTADEVAAWATRCGQAAGGARLADVLAACDQARFGGRDEVDVATLASEVAALLPALATWRPSRAAR